MLNRRNVLGATVVVGVMNLGAAAAWAQAGRKAATPDELRHLIGRATRLSVLSDRITRCQAQKSLQVLTTRADKVLADFSLMVGGLLLARALGTGALSDRVLRAAKSAVI